MISTSVTLILISGFCTVCLKHYINQLLIVIQDLGIQYAQASVLHQPCKGKQLAHHQPVRFAGHAASLLL